MRRQIIEKEIQEADNTRKEKYSERKVNYWRLLKLDQII